MNPREEEIPLPTRYYALHLYLSRDDEGKRVVHNQTILARTGVSETSLYRLKKKWDKKRSLSDSPRRGRPPKLTPKDETRLKIIAQKTPLKFYREIADDYSLGIPQQDKIS